MDNMFDSLKRDHQEAFELMSELEDTGGHGRRNVLTRLRERLSRHIALEEESLYPALEGDRETRETVRECYNDHTVIKSQLKEMSNIPVDGEDFDAMIETLTEYFDSHVREEEGSLFKQAHELLGKKKLGELNRRVMSERKKAA